jgi:murein L,D-transpeptidase YafK
VKLTDLVVGGGAALALAGLLCFLRSSKALESLVRTEPPAEAVQKKTMPIKVPKFTMQQVSSTSRSREAAARVAPALIRDLRAMGLEYGAPIFIRILKEERKLELFVEGDESYRLFRSYAIVACSGRLGPKLREGDRQAPEGFYFVTPARMNPRSRFHLSFNLGYPNRFDRAHGRTGSALMVHGGKASIGCYAMTDAKIEEIYAMADAALRNGQKYFRVHCFPFRMTAENLRRHRRSKWLPFWKNLKQGYDQFEHTSRPPNARVRRGKYTFKLD